MQVYVFETLEQCSIKVHEEVPENYHRPMMYNIKVMGVNVHDTRVSSTK